MNAVTLSGVIRSEKIELRHTPNNTPVTSFLLKVKRDFKKGQEFNGDHYDYITVVCWNRMAELVVNTYETGQVIEVKGSIRTGNRELKGYTVYKIEDDSNIEVEGFRVPVFEIYAQHISKLA